MTQETLHFVGISGSLRAGSFSAALLAEIAAMSDDRTRITAFRLQDVPLYNQDLEPTPGSAPAPVLALREAIGAADGLIVVSPEYNWGMSGVLKNALDWASRPAYKSVLAGKPSLIITTSPFPLGGVRAQTQVRQTLSATLSRVVNRPEIVIAHVGDKLAGGHLSDETTRGHIKAGLADLAAEVARARRS
jgi:chromate reductase, NAD(P)H dehydrogenase (quinone)